jgi:hypothetical protein
MTLRTQACVQKKQLYNKVSEVRWNTPSSDLKQMFLGFGVRRDQTSLRLERHTIKFHGLSRGREAHVLWGDMGPHYSWVSPIQFGAIKESPY